MEKQEMEMETGNRNWKLKWEQKTLQSLLRYFLHSVLSQCSSILLSNRYRTGFMSHALPLLLWEQDQHSYSCSLVPRPTFSSIACSVWSKLWLEYNSPIPNHCPSPKYLPMLVFWFKHSSHVHTESAGYGTPKIEYCWEHKQWLTQPMWEILINHTLHTGALKKVWERG